eukprot:4291488-Pleurochrysis_carterae.AAC.1
MRTKLWPTGMRAGHLCEERLARVEANEPRVGSVRAAHRHGGQLSKLCELELAVIFCCNQRIELDDNTGIALAEHFNLVAKFLRLARQECLHGDHGLLRGPALAHLAALERCHTQKKHVV